MDANTFAPTKKNPADRAAQRKTLPLMLGAKDVAFPKLNLASLWIYAFGAVFAVTASSGMPANRCCA